MEGFIVLFVVVFVVVVALALGFSGSVDETRW